MGKICKLIAIMGSITMDLAAAAPRVAARNGSLRSRAKSPRWKFTRKYLILRQDPNNNSAQKLGMFNKNTWAAYVRNSEAFVKRTTAEPSKQYPDFGCSFETFTNNEFFEIETLGPLTKLAPGKTAELVEHWGLFRHVELDTLSDDTLDRTILPLVDQVPTN